MTTPDTDSKFRRTPNEFKLTIGQNEPLGAAFIPCPFVFLFIRRTDINVFYRRLGRICVALTQLNQLA